MTTSTAPLLPFNAFNGPAADPRRDAAHRSPVAGTTGRRGTAPGLTVMPSEGGKGGGGGRTTSGAGASTSRCTTSATVTRHFGGSLGSGTQAQTQTARRGRSPIAGSVGRVHHRPAAPSPELGLGSRTKRVHATHTVVSQRTAASLAALRNGVSMRMKTARPSSGVATSGSSSGPLTSPPAVREDAAARSEVVDAWVSPPPVDDHDILARVRERQALHELIRVGFSRVEDLKLLQDVVVGKHAHKLGLGEQVVLEAQLREEWRVQREETLMGPTGGLETFVSVDDNAEGKILRDKLAGLNEMLQRERQASIAKAKKKGLGAYTTNAGAAGRMRTTLRGAHVMYGGQRSSTGIRGSATARSAWVSASGHEEISGSGPGNGGFWSPPRMARPAAAGGRQTVSSQSKRPQTVKATTGGDGHTVVRAYGAGTGAGTQRGVKSKRPRTAHPAGEKKGAGLDGRGLDSLHKQMARVQRELSVGLANHKYAEGGGSRTAAEALRRNFQDAREAFAESAAEARAAAGAHAAEHRKVMERQATAAAREGDEDGSESPLFTPPSSSIPPARRRQVERMQFGWLGIPQGDLRAAEHLRLTRAAQRIQRTARQWLARRAAARRAAEEEAAAAAAFEARRHVAAAVLQARVRGAAGRRAAAVARVDRTRRRAAAWKILRAWRRRRAWVRERKGALARRDAARTTAARWALARGAFVADCAAAEAALITAGDKASLLRWRAARRVQTAYRAHTARSHLSRRREAVGTIQRYVRGWIARREGWWAQFLAGAVAARARRRRWAEHRSEIAASSAAERVLLHTAVYAGAELAEVGDRLARESDRFARAWASHEASTRRRAMAGPLPKNWVPQSDPLTGKVFYLNLKNGELHREHPVLRPILPQLRADKAKARERFERDVLTPARAYAQRLREGAEERERVLLRELAAARQRWRAHGRVAAALLVLERRQRQWEMGASGTTGR